MCANRLATAKDCRAKIHKTTICHFSCTKKVYRTAMERVHRQWRLATWKGENKEICGSNQGWIVCIAPFPVLSQPSEPTQANCKGKSRTMYNKAHMYPPALTQSALIVDSLAVRQCVHLGMSYWRIMQWSAQSQPARQCYIFPS